ncbi:MAG: Y-family DNA polymerase [Rhodothermaceae bacterium]|nr:Y-family DNA polymerase [Rhodothermaceae bacterium]
MHLPPIGLVDCNHFYAAVEQVFAPQAKHVIVGSNNDGCAIARSPGTRDHVPMGAPLFQYQDVFDQQNISVFSANFALYADFSNRITAALKACVPDVFWYSIDESFATFPTAVDAYEVQHTIFQWTGIRTSIGIAETKTLAKVANHIAKKRPEHEGVYYLPKPGPARNEVLASVDVGTIWGVGRRWKKRLYELDIRTALDLCKANPSAIRKQFSVVLERTVRELNGTRCIPLEETPAQHQHRCCSRSFGTPIMEYQDLKESIAYFASRVSARMRRDGLIGQYVQVFVTTKNNTPDPYYSNSFCMALPEPGNYAPTISRYATIGLRHIYRKGYLYRRAGINILGLTRPTNRQRDLFSGADPAKEQALMAVLDRVNAQYGRDSLRLASEGTGDQIWKMRQVQRSPRYTTRWAELPEAA